MHRGRFPFGGKVEWMLHHMYKYSAGLLSRAVSWYLRMPWRRHALTMSTMRQILSAQCCPDALIARTKDGRVFSKNGRTRMTTWRIGSSWFASSRVRGTWKHVSAVRPTGLGGCECNGDRQEPTQRCRGRLAERNPGDGNRI